MSSRWADDPAQAALDAQRKRDKEAKKAAKAAAKQHQRKLQQEEQERQQLATQQVESERPSKRRRISQDGDQDQPVPLLRFEETGWRRARTIESYEPLNHIEEGTYGSVSRGRELATGDVVAVKKMKNTDPIASGGMPVTTLREIQALSAVKGHEHIVELREVVTGPELDAKQIFLVMEFVEHDLKVLMDDMEEPWLPSETKTLMSQLGSAVEYLHDHWILHVCVILLKHVYATPNASTTDTSQRDLKTSNILMNNRGQIKIADFGMARSTSDPPPRNLTSLVVTLWYRSPELLLGATEYDQSIDMWSLGCIFGELIENKPILNGSSELDQAAKIFTLCGVPDEQSWPGLERLPAAKSMRLLRQRTGNNARLSTIRERFPNLTDAGIGLLSSLLSLDPKQRISAKAMLAHDYFREQPLAKSTAMFPTFPSKAGQERRRKRPTPHAPIRGQQVAATVDLSKVFSGNEPG